jgi:hypothetical protein
MVWISGSTHNLMPQKWVQHEAITLPFTQAGSNQIAIQRLKVVSQSFESLLIDRGSGDCKSSQRYA